MTKKKSIKKKLEIVFDPQKRKEFLTGFQKRKNERRKRAKDQLDRNVKEERKKIRQEIKDGIRHLKKSFEPLRELTEQDKKEDEYEDDDVKVKIVELSTDDLTSQMHMLGENRPEESEESDNEEISDGDNRLADANCVPGMDFDINKKRKRNNAQVEHENDEPTTSKPHNGISKTEHVELRSKKDLNRFTKTKTLKKLKQSKVFKLKERFDKQANKKKVKRDRNSTLRSLPKNQRKKLKVEPCRYSKGRLLNRKELRKKKMQKQ